MVTSIAPAVFAGNRRKWLVSAVIFVIGGALGGMATGTLLSVVGAAAATIAPIRRATLLALAFGAFGYALHEQGIWHLPTPSPRRQVPRDWRARYPLPIVALRYGLDLGSGISTQITSASVYVLCAALVAVGDLTKGTVLMGSYGFIRSLANMAFSAKPTTMEAALMRSRAMIAWRPVLPSLSAITLLILAGTCGIVLQGGLL